MQVHRTVVKCCAVCKTTAFVFMVFDEMISFSVSLLTSVFQHGRLKMSQKHTECNWYCPEMF